VISAAYTVDARFDLDRGIIGWHGESKRPAKIRRTPEPFAGLHSVGIGCTGNTDKEKCSLEQRLITTRLRGEWSGIEGSNL